MNKLVVLLVTLIVSAITLADVTPKGKILQTEGHSNPDCRTVVFKENSTGITKAFRIKNVAGDDDISSVILTAIISQKDVTIFYNPSVTTGCGTEPKIDYVTLYN
ncbi:hypothetical protein R50072_29270 [Simiduia litorea]|uniref:hypothetical protein n=1 Tax=Simiduia litorea TaxID=1435348 RepID=UPI0036F1B514